MIKLLVKPPEETSFHNAYETRTTSEVTKYAKTEWLYWHYLNLNRCFPNSTVAKVAREMVAEMFGCWVLTFIVVCAGCQENLYNTAFVEQILAFGWALFLGVLLAAPVSGGHINPAVTLGQALCGFCDWWKVPFYWFAQLLGAFLAGFFAYWQYYDTIHYKPNAYNTSLNFFCTFPSDYLLVSRRWP